MSIELNEKAQQLADTTSAYELARRLAEMEQDRDQLRGCFHNACEELTALKAALTDEGGEVPVGPALSLAKALKGERDSLSATLGKICDIFGIGEAARTSSVLLQNIENAARFARYIDAIEVEFFTAEGEDGEPESLLNRWGDESCDNYVGQFRQALARRDADKVRQGRAEALTIILELDAEEGLDDYADSYPIADTGDYGCAWNRTKLAELLRADDSVWTLRQEAEGEYWHNLGLREQFDRHRDQLKAEWQTEALENLVPRVADEIGRTLNLSEDQIIEVEGWLGGHAELRRQAKGTAG